MCVRLAPHWDISEGNRPSTIRPLAYMCYVRAVAFRFFGWRLFKGERVVCGYILPSNTQVALIIHSVYAVYLTYWDNPSTQITLCLHSRVK